MMGGGLSPLLVRQGVRRLPVSPNPHPHLPGASWARQQHLGIPLESQVEFSVCMVATIAIANWGRSCPSCSLSRRPGWSHPQQPPAPTKQS